MRRGRATKNLALQTVTLCLCLFFAAAAHAQIPQYVTPQSVTAILANNLPCTGSPQTFSTAAAIPNFGNLGQTQHYAYMSIGSAATVSMEIDGIDGLGNVYRISDTARISNKLSGTNPVLTATGYFPNIQIVVDCSTGFDFDLGYTGTSATSNQNSGAYQLAQVDKVLSSGSPANTNLAVPTFQPPFSSSFGTLYFQYGTTGPAGSVLVVSCQGEASTGNLAIYDFSLATTGLQIFTVPDSTCPSVTVTYVSGGASATNFALDYIFPQAGFKGTKSYTHVTTTTATVVKAGPGTLHTLVVGTPAAGTITLFDLAPTGCTGTPVTNVVSVITATATFPAAPEIYDTLFKNGICLQLSAAMDVTASSQ